MHTTPQYESGSELKIAFVFSCPGRMEKNAKKPAAGKTGENLNYLLSKLETAYSLTDFKRGKITIANAWNNVEFKGEGGTGRSEATLSEVINIANLDRLGKELQCITDYIVCGGVNAEKAVSILLFAGKLNSSCKVINIPHLSTRGLCASIISDENGNKILSKKNGSTTNTLHQRLDSVAKEINSKV
ncbi:hypothetical protein RI537_09055 [Aeromonas salmonicida]|uniref:hypothetical protein n=1 Tax=Aeromonas salmonicida TaxID=645 RepID=UPI00341837A3